MKFLTCRVSSESFCKKTVFLPLLVAILNFKSAFISETERDKAISMKFLTRRLPESFNDFS